MIRSYQIEVRTLDSDGNVVPTPVAAGWTRYLRGCWQSEPPTKSGFFACADADGHVIGEVHFIRRGTTLYSDDSKMTKRARWWWSRSRPQTPPQRAPRPKVKANLQLV